MVQDAVFFRLRLCENSNVELACRISGSISSMRKPIALAISVGRGQLRKQFCASLARSRFYTTSIHMRNQAHRVWSPSPLGRRLALSLLGYIPEHGRRGDDAVELCRRAQRRSVVAARCIRPAKRSNTPAEPVFAEVLNRGDTMLRRDIITLLGAAEWPACGSRKLGPKSHIC